MARFLPSRTRRFLERLAISVESLLLGREEPYPIPQATTVLLLGLIAEGIPLERIIDLAGTGPWDR